MDDQAARDLALQVLKQQGKDAFARKKYAGRCILSQNQVVLSQ
jgi:hypothetical protein